MAEPETERPGLLRRARLALDHLVRALSCAIAEYGRDRGPQLSAAIAYRVLFSLVPLATVLVSIAGLLLQDEQRRADLTAYLLDAFPLAEEAGIDIEQYLTEIPTSASIAGLVSIAILVWAASGMMGAIRIGVTTAIDGRAGRPYLRSKLLDLVLVFALGAMLVGSFGLSIVTNAVTQWSGGVADELTPVGLGRGGALGVIVPLLLTFSVCVLSYRYLPVSRPTWRQVVVPAVLAALASEVVKVGFSFYLGTVATYDVVYGSLGSLFAFLFVVYLEASVLLLGAELTSVWLRTVEPGPPAEESLGRRLWHLVRGQWVPAVSPRPDAPSPRTSPPAPPPDPAGRSPSPDPRPR